MVVVPDNGQLLKIAIIDPAKKYGEEGQYVTYEGSLEELEDVAEKARWTRKEVRWYYRDLRDDSDDPVASQVIVTEIPPGHIQPFHTHRTLHEVTIVMHGEIRAVDSDHLEEGSPARELFDAGRVIKERCMVVEGPGTRHTIYNTSQNYATMVTIQTARIPLDEFPHDWERDKPKA